MALLQRTVSKKMELPTWNERPRHKTLALRSGIHEEYEA